MRRAAVVGTVIAGILVFGLMLVPIVGASTSAAPALQTTETATTAATTAATAAATAAATTAATTTSAATTPTTGPGALPRTGGDSGMGVLLLAAAALLILGVAGMTLMASRRSTRL
jgi:LPXTG-motif cell wall-anchored protein